MFKGVDINPEHVFEEFFHDGLYAALLNIARKLYMQPIFQAIFYEPDHIIALSMPIKRYTRAKRPRRPAGISPLPEAQFFPIFQGKA
ncbi:hypothetical protein V6L80_15530 [Erwinia persicina]